MSKTAETKLTFRLSDTLKVEGITLESNLMEPDRRLTLLNAYIQLAAKHGLGYADMGGELMAEARKIEHGKDVRL